MSLNTILVTGGAGFIGSHLCDALIFKGIKIINIDSFNDYYNPEIKYKNVTDTKRLLKENDIREDLYIVECGDIRDTGFLRAIAGKYEIDAVIHLAAYAGVRPSVENPRLYADVNISGTLNLLELCRQKHIRTFIFGSSSSVYGNNQKVPFSEDDPVDFPISPYAATKKAGELLCYTYCSLYGMNIACLRFFTVYGPRQRPDLAIHKFSELICKGHEIPYYGDGTSERDYTYVQDIVEGIQKALTYMDNGTGRYEIFNLGGSATVSLERMLKVLEKELGIEVKIKRMPAQPGDVRRTWADIAKSTKLLGYYPKIHFEEGIQKFVRWYLNYSA